MTTKLLRGVPPKLKGKIARAADRRGVSVNGLIVETLSADFGIVYAASTARGPKERTAYANIVLSMPEELSDAIDARADATGATQRNVMMRIIAEAFGEPFVPTGRWASERAA